MPRSRSGETKARILAVALELFGEQGVQQTSLQQIADRLGMTKPALYYHFDSREDLIRSLFEPMVEQMEAFLVAQEAAAGEATPRALLEGYFDLMYRYRRFNELILRELMMLAHLDLVARVTDWRLRIMAMLVGPEPTLDQRARAIVAIGGLADCTVVFADAPADELRQAAVGAACSALGV
ncbi:TetR/AcrR family transcriptional regulator [Flindersiella endophytica]